MSSAQRIQTLEDTESTVGHPLPCETAAILRLITGFVRTF